MSPPSAVPTTVHNITFYSATEVADLAGVTRQTLWRWKKSGCVPAGRRYRGRELLFTLEEVESVYAHAHRLEPEDAAGRLADQLDLFSSRTP
ncbi:MAG: hypothetical protein SangKO_100160 [Sandaracinaceae bacterium]